MRIWSVIPVMGAGGAEVVASALVRDARSRGHAVRLASAGGFRAEALRESGIEHLDLPLTGRRPRDLTRSVRRLRTAARSGMPDVVHAHNVKASLVARAALGRAVPVVTTLHGVPAAELTRAGRLLRWSSDQVVAVSPHVAEQLAEAGYPRARSSTIANALEPMVRRDRAAARARLGLDAQTPVVLCAARMVDQKRHDLLIAAWSQVSDATLLLAGDGPNRPALEAAVSSRGLGDRVRFLGQRSDVDWLLAACDAAVLPTDWEGLPISLLEAMSLGVPVVASRVGGIAETLGDAVSLVEPGSSAALAMGLRAVLADADHRADLGARGEALVRERFWATRMLDAYDDLYRQVAARPVRRSA